jgi:hypothetical protein
MGAVVVTSMTEMLVLFTGAPGDFRAVVTTLLVLVGL